MPSPLPNHRLLPFPSWRYRAMGVTLVVTLSYAWPSWAGTTIYQYRDAHGQMTLSDQPPPHSTRDVIVHKDPQISGPSPDGAATTGLDLPSVIAPSNGIPSTSPEGVTYTRANPGLGIPPSPSLSPQAQRQADQADLDMAVVRAQAALEDAMAEQKAGTALAPNEQSYAGYFTTYPQRQQALSQKVQAAQAALEQAQIAAKP